MILSDYLLNNGINAPYIWYLSTLKQKYDENIKLLHPDGYFFDETEFLRLLAKKKVSLKKFIEYVKRSYIAAKFDKNDFSGTWAFYKDFLFSRLKNKLKRKKTNECKE